MQSSRTLRIGQVARAARVGVQTVRYYERRGILPRAPRGSSGYRHYGAETVGRIRAVKRAQQLGFTLDEIRELGRLRRARGPGAEVMALVSGKLRDIDHRLRDLRKMRRALRAVVETCRCGGDLTRCDVLAELADE